MSVRSPSVLAALIASVGLGGTVLMQASLDAGHLLLTAYSRDILPWIKTLLLNSRNQDAKSSHRLLRLLPPYIVSTATDLDGASGIAPSG